MSAGPDIAHPTPITTVPTSESEMSVIGELGSGYVYADLEG